MTFSSKSIEELRSRIEQDGNIPSVPTIVQDILEVTGNPRSGARDVQAVVEKDPSCAMKLLRLANSAYYGFSRQVTNVREAIVIIGIEGVKNVAMSIGVAECFLKGDKTGQDFLKDLWIHSMACAVAAQELAKRVGFNPESQAYCGGLIHDVGKIVLLNHFGLAYTRVVHHCKTESASLQKSEETLFGASHTHVGGWVADLWDLPKVVKASMTDHHMEIRADRADKFLLIVAIADILAYSVGVGHGGNGAPPKATPQLVSSLALGQSEIAEISAVIRRQAGQFDALLEIAS